MNITNFDDYKFALESLSGGKNTAIMDDAGLPSVMYYFPKMRYADVFTGGTQETLSCFYIDNTEVSAYYVSKYPNIVMNDRAYSLPLQDPRAWIDWDESLRVCRNKNGAAYDKRGYWGMTPNDVWQAIGFWSRANNTQPHGNNYAGRDVDHANERGTQSYAWEYATNWNNQAYGKAENGNFLLTGRTLTGSGPVTWNHDHSINGITDMNGNVWEWTAGMRLMAGEIQIIPHGRSMLPETNMGRNSTEWKAILPDGSLVEPGTTGTLKVNSLTAGNANLVSANIGHAQIDVVRDKPNYTGGETDEYYAYNYGTLEALTAKDGVKIPQMLLNHGFMVGETDLEGDCFWSRNYGERLPLRGGAFHGYGRGAGVFALSLSDPRTTSARAVGFRSAFVSL